MKERMQVHVRLLHMIDRPPLQQLFNFSVIDKRVPSAMAMSDEVEDFKKRVQGSLDRQREKTIKKYELMLENFKRAVDQDGLPRIDDTIDDDELIEVKDDVEEEAEAQSEACVYSEVFAKLHLNHIQHLRVDMELFYDQVMEKLMHKAGQIGCKNTKGDENLLLAVGYLPTSDESKKAKSDIVTIGNWLRKQLPNEHQAYVNSIKVKFAADLKRAKLDQLRSCPHPKPMLRRQNGYLGFVYTLHDEPLMIEVLDMHSEHINSMVSKIQEKSLKRKIKQEPGFVGLPIKKERIK